jgi:hypothetical protein
MVSVALIEHIGLEYLIFNKGTTGWRRKFRMQIAQKFERLLETYRHPDGRRWSGQEIDEATGGVVTRSYGTNLKKGRIENPGFEKLRAIAKVMGFSPELWFEQASDFGTGRSLESLPEAELSPTRRTVCSTSSETKSQVCLLPTLKWRA